MQPTGTVIVPILSGPDIVSFVSNDGGVSFTGPYTVAAAESAGFPSLRSGPLPSAEIDAAGTVYVVWQDCSFEPSCTADDIVMSTSVDGVAWTPSVRIPIDPVGSGVGHFIPGLGVDPTTSGSTARLALAYYYHSPESTCGELTCGLNVGFVSSLDGGANWASPIQLAGPMSLLALPLTNQGFMVGDYISTSFVDGRAFPVFAVTTKKTPCTLGAKSSCNAKMVVPVGGLPVGQ